MELLQEVLTFVAKIVLQVALISSFFGVIGMVVMMSRSMKHTKKSQASQVDTMFLVSSSPGFSRFPIFNAPDDLGIGVYAALALEQAGALDDVKTQVEVNLWLYPEWPATYLSAARYYALVGDKQKARDYLSIAKTVTAARHQKQNIPQLNIPVVESLVASKAPPVVASTSLTAIYDDLRKKPHLLLVARSTKLALIGLSLLLLWVVLKVAINLLVKS